MNNINIFDNSEITLKTPIKKIFTIYLIASIVFSYLLCKIFLNFEYTKKTIKIYPVKNNKTSILLVSKNPTIKIEHEEYKSKIKKKNQYYEAIIDFKKCEEKEVIIEVEEKTTIMKTLVKELREDLNNERT
ncbi:MAG: hypothetical protein RSA91_04730 [Bacilli bacterium]